MTYFPPVIADILFFVQYAVIPCVSGQSDAQQTGAHGLCLCGVGAGVLSPVTAEYPPAVYRVKSQQPARRQHQQRGQACGKVIHDVIRPCRDQTNIFVGRFYISQHGVHRVDRLIEEAQRRAAQRQKQQRRHHAVRGIFRYSFHCRTGHRRVIQRRGIPAHDHGDCIPRPADIAALQCTVDLHALITQRLDSQYLPAHHTFNCQSQPQTDPFTQPQQQRGG